MRTIIEKLNKGAGWFVSQFRDSLNPHYSIDETMVPYFGRHSWEHFIQGKPVRFGFKVTIIYGLKFVT